MSRRASLPGADELFRRTTERPTEATQGAERQVSKSTKLQVASEPVATTEPEPKKAPRHDEKITFYCTSDDLMALESTRLALRSKHGIAADRGKIVRAALAYVLEDFDARGEDSILLHRLSG